jgi:hypothetical protein
MGNIWHAHPIAAEVLESHVRRLVGQQLQSTEPLDYDWLFRFSGDVTVQTGSAWRLLDHSRLKVTSDDHGHSFGLPEPVDAAARVMSTTAARPVRAASIVVKSGDLLIDFGDEVQLQLLQMSCGYESWHLRIGETQVTCCGGGRVVQYREDPIRPDH